MLLGGRKMNLDMLGLSMITLNSPGEPSSNYLTICILHVSAKYMCSTIYGQVRVSILKGNGHHICFPHSASMQLVWIGRRYEQLQRELALEEREMKRGGGGGGEGGGTFRI